MAAAAFPTEEGEAAPGAERLGECRTSSPTIASSAALPNASRCAPWNASTPTKNAPISILRCALIVVPVFRRVRFVPFTKSLTCRRISSAGSSQRRACASLAGGLRQRGAAPHRWRTSRAAWLLDQHRRCSPIAPWLWHCGREAHHVGHERSPRDPRRNRRRWAEWILCGRSAVAFRHRGAGGHDRAPADAVRPSAKRSRPGPSEAQAGDPGVRAHRPDPGFHFFGNVQVGRDVTIDELHASHHAVVFAFGAQTDRRMGVPGEDLRRSHTATEFVGWFNGHPDYRDRTFDLNQETVAIIGQGNVAADVTRILAKSVDQLRNTDIAEHALDALARSRVKEIHVIGRRGPVQAKFTTKELRELGEIGGCATVADPADLVLNEESERELRDRDNLNGAENLALFRAFSVKKLGVGQRTIRFRFHLSPMALVGDGRVERLILTRNRLEGPPFAQIARPTGKSVELACGLVFRSIGYRGVAIPGLPFDSAHGTVPHVGGRVLEGTAAVPGLYVTGWLKRGPTGIIGTNRADSVETIAGPRGSFARLSSREGRYGGVARAAGGAWRAGLRLPKLVDARFGRDQSGKAERQTEGEIHPNR